MKMEGTIRLGKGELGNFGIAISQFQNSKLQASLHSNKTIIMSSRRKFLQNASALAAGGVVLSSFDSKTLSILKNKMAPSDQINIAAIGVNGMGFADLSAMLKHEGVNLVALCDIDKNVLDKRSADLSKLNVDMSKLKTFGDYRKVLELKDVNAGIIGALDNWHCKILVDA